jgi:hypothetical protein
VNITSPAADRTATKRHLSVTIAYLLVGLAWMVSALGVSGALLPTFTPATIGDPDILATVHAILLGALLTSALGVLAQVVPIAFQAPPLPRPWLLTHLAAHTAAVIIMVAGFLSADWTIVAVGGSLLLTALLGFAIMLLRSHRLARNRTQVHRALLWPLSTLVLVMLLGITAATAPASAPMQLLESHTLLAAFGFWWALVLVISYKFLPMFALSHGYKVSLSTAVLLLYGGLCGLIGGVWWLGPYGLSLAGAGALTMLVGAMIAARDVRRILRARRKAPLLRPVRSALIATVWLAVSGLGLLVAACTQSLAIALPASYAFVLGGLVPLLLSYEQKIFPFLWFEYRFSHHPDRRTAPPLDRMIPDRPARLALIGYQLALWWGLCLCVMVAVMNWHIGQAVATAQGVVLALCVIAMGVTLVNVLRIGGPRRDA